MDWLRRAVSPDQLQIRGRLMLLFLNRVPGNGITFPFLNTKDWKRKHVSVSKNKMDQKQHSQSLETETCFHFQLACNGGGEWTG